MYNSSTTDNKNKIQISKTHQTAQNITHPKMKFSKKNYDPTTFDNSTSTSTIQISIHQSRQKKQQPKFQLQEETSDTAKIIMQIPTPTQFALPWMQDSSAKDHKPFDFTRN
jgi:hypothetical protein